ncbi:MAG: hypothetical protein IPG58_03450 [Acidobacteria bacterium]|nr:hypothetical protein [Acidobacteriota bacterium]
MPRKRPDADESTTPMKGHSVTCRFCGQKNAVKPDYVNGEANCGRCKLPLSNEPHKKFANLHKNDYVHPLDKKALAAVKAIPGVDSALKKLLEWTWRIGDPRDVHGQCGQGHAEPVPRPVRQTRDRLQHPRR